MKNYKLICKKCGNEFLSNSSTKFYCKDCEKELRTLNCMICGEDFEFKGELKRKDLIKPICNDCYKKLPGYNKNNKRKGSVRICYKGHTYISNSNRDSCPVCNNEIRTVKCEICGEEYVDKDKHIGRFLNNQKICICNNCKEKLPGNGVHIRKCFNCGEYFKANHNFENCPVCEGVSITPKVGICKNCGKEFKYRGNKKIFLCNECKIERSKSPAVKTFEELSEREDVEIVDNVLMLPISKTKEPNKTCNICGRRYFGVKTQTTCKNCYHIIKCETCGFEFLSKSKYQRFCSKSCSVKAQMKNRIENGNFDPRLWINSVDKINKNNKIDIDSLTIINEDNYKEFNFGGVWGIIDKDTEELLDVHLTVDISKEYKRDINIIKSGKGNDKYQYIASKNFVCVYFVSYDYYEQGLIYEMFIATEYNAKFWYPQPGVQNKIYKELTQNKIEILWDKIAIGDKFPDSSIIKNIYDWANKDCYEIINSEGSLIVSFDHIIQIDNDLTKSFDLTNREKEKMNITEDNWYCTEDIYKEFKNGVDIKINGDSVIINFIGNRKVRCIETNTGYYEINKIKNHNSARKLFYGMSDMYMMEETCNSDGSDGILGCTCPGGVCRRCAEKSGMGKAIKQLASEQKDGKIDGVKIGGLISSNATEPLTQLYLDAIHNSSSDNSHTNIVNTFDCYASSPIIKQASEAQTTKERRRIISDGLKKLYKENDVKIDDYNIELIAKKMTSYKRTSKGLRLINEDKGELCDIVSINSIGGATRNIYKKAAIGRSFTTLSHGGEVIMNQNDSFKDIFRDLM